MVGRQVRRKVQIISVGVLLLFPVALSASDILFTSNTNYRTGEGPYDIASADLDNDMDLDLAVVNFYNHTLSIYKNKGTGIS